MIDRSKKDSIFLPSPNTVMSVIKEIKSFTESEDHSDFEKSAVLESLLSDYVEKESAIGNLLAGIIGRALEDIGDDEEE